MIAASKDAASTFISSYDVQSDLTESPISGRNPVTTKLHLFFTVAALSLAVGACSSPAGLDCADGDSVCQTLAPGGNGLAPGGNGSGLSPPVETNWSRMELNALRTPSMFSRVVASKRGCHSPSGRAAAQAREVVLTALVANIKGCIFSGTNT